MKKGKASPVTSGSQNKIGYFLYDLDSNRVIASENGACSFIPASTAKVLTSVFALNVLGPDYKFKTTLAHTGEIHNGCLKGDLYLKGTGDPLLSSSHLMNMAQYLLEHGIKQVEGNFYFDESDLLATDCIQPGCAPWAPYNCGISALSVDFNQCRVKWFEGDQGALGSYFIPSTCRAQLSRLNTSLPQETSILYSKEGGNDLWSVSAHEPANGEKRLPVKEPAKYTADLFKRICSFLHISIPNPTAGVLPTHSKVLHTHESLPVVEIVDRTLEFSNNIMSELLQMSAARHLVSRPVSSQDAAEINWFKKELPEVDRRGFEFFNGSGLNSKNRITPQQLVEVLKFADLSKFLGRSFLPLLPVSGWKGRLLQRMTEPDLAFRIWTKPGGMNFVYTMAGYLFRADGSRAAFSIMMNNFEERMKVDQVTDPLPDEINSSAQKWSLQAIENIDQLIKEWCSS